jgi:hypothetical protein
MLIVNSAHAGLYLSIETVNPLPAKWSGFLTDHRRLRTLANPNLDTSRSASLIASTYADALLKLDAKAEKDPVELADLGALHLRRGYVEKALGVLRAAHTAHPRNFHIAANLGTAWQMAGDLAQAEAALADAVRLAPPEHRANEEAHRALVQARLKEKPGELDAMEPVPARPTAADIAQAQLLALWLPQDGRLLWRLGELAKAAGDDRAAAGILDGCVTELGMKSVTLRKRRQAWRAAVEALELKEEHAKASPIAFKSSRALARLLDESKLPKITADGVNALPWAALGETTIARPFKVQALDYVVKLDGKRVSLTGFMRPLEASKAGDVSAFILTEYAVGCWFCENPEPNGIIAVELKDAVESTRNAVRVEGVFELNRSDPEAYLFRLKEAKVSVAD